MKFTRIVSILALGCICVGVARSDAAETKEQRDARMQWWRNAKFGMFIHYGLYSGLAGQLDGKKYGGGAEWIQSYSGTDSDRYAKLTEPLFKPQKGCVKQWVDLARQAGCKYVVLTSKHHEGFALFDSKLTHFNSKKVADFDIVREYVDACKADGLKAGFYHSVIDWHHPDYDWRQAQGLPYPENNKKLPVHANPDHSKYQDFLHGQVDELLSNYGKIDIMWWDFSSNQFDGDKAWRATELLRKVHEKQPGIICNNRLYASHNTNGPLVVTTSEKGDFTTPEQHIPPQGIEGDWEVCMTLNGTWGYAEHNHNWKSNDTLIRGLADTVSKGGNFLLNIGPRADGSLPDETIRSFKAIGDWMKMNGEAIYDTTANPFKRSFPWGVVTQKGDILYLIVYEIPANGKLNLPFSAKGTLSASALADGKKVPVKSSATGVELDLSGVTPVPSATVVKLVGRGHVIDAVMGGKDGFVLEPDMAVLGAGQQLETAGGKTHVGFWTDPDAVLSWKLSAGKAGKYKVDITYACEDKSAGLPVKITVTPGNSSLVWKVEGSGTWQNFKSVSPGIVTLPAGKSTLSLKADGKPAPGVANIREITLTPVK